MYMYLSLAVYTRPLIGYEAKQSFPIKNNNQNSVYRVCAQYRSTQLAVNYHNFVPCKSFEINTTEAVVSHVYYVCYKYADCL